MQINNAMVVMDKPKHQQVALSRARALQQATGAHLRLVAFCWNALTEQAEVFSAHQRRALKHEIVRDREVWLREQVRDVGLAAADVAVEVRWTDDIAGWVSANALPDACDMVLKSVHHSKTLTHTPLDWQLLRACRVPVYLAAARRRKPTGNVLATLDLRHSDRKHTALNLRVLEAAHHLAEIAGAKVHVVNAIEFSQVLKDLDIIDTAHVRRKAIANSRELMDALLAPYAIAKSRIHMPLGKVGQAVAATARKVNADVLVVGTSARRGAGAALLGNSAERILSRAPCDVLTVRP